MLIEKSSFRFHKPPVQIDMALEAVLNGRDESRRLPPEILSLSIIPDLSHAVGHVRFNAHSLI